MSHPWLSHLPFTTSTSSSSFTLPSVTQEHAAQSVQQAQLREHPVHPAHLQAGVKTCRVAETRAPQLPQVMSPKNLRPSRGSKLILQIHVNCMMYRKKLEKKITELLSPKKWRNLEKLGRLVCRIPNYQRRLTSNLRCISTILWKALQILISKIGELQKMLTSPLYSQKASGKPNAMVMQEREVSAQYTQADRKESLRSHSSEDQKALEKPNALFSSDQGNLIRSSVFRNANPSSLRGSLLEGNKDHLLNQARSDLAKQELHVESLNKCFGELQGQTEEQRLALQDAQYGVVESRREQARLQEELSMKERVLRDTQVRNMHEMGEIKRAQELRGDEVSVQ